MLVLTRKTRQEIKIGENITITVLQITRNSIRVGIDAPQSVRINRGELLGSQKDPELKSRIPDRTACKRQEQFPEKSKPNRKNVPAGKWPMVRKNSLTRRFTQS